MDILNWLYLAKNKFVRTAPSSDKDLMIFGAKVGFNKRGDLYQNYGMTIGDFKNTVVNGEFVYEQGTFAPYTFTTDPLPNYGIGQVNFPGIPKNNIYRMLGFALLPGFTNSYSVKLGEIVSPTLPANEIAIVSNSSSIQEDGITGIGRAISVMAPGAIGRSVLDSSPVVLTQAYLRADNTANPLVQEVFLVLTGAVNFTCTVTIDFLFGVPEGDTFTWVR